MRARLALGADPWPPELPVWFAEGEGEIIIFKIALRLQKSFRRGGDGHHGIASVPASLALPKLLVRNVRDEVGTENCTHGIAQFG